MQAVNEPGRATPLSATETRPDRATRDHPPSLEVRSYHTPRPASNAITLAFAGQVAASDLAKPAATQMTLDLVLDAVVGDLAQAPVKRGAVGQTTRGCLLSNDHENPPCGQHTVKRWSQGSAITRFGRAVRLGVPRLVVAAAHELPKPVLLRDALQVVLVLASAGAEEFPAASARFGAWMMSERRLGLVEAQLLFSALAALACADRAAGGEAAPCPA